MLGHRRLSIMDEPFGYLPLHHLHLGMDERQSQPSSGGWARDGLIHLSEWFKDSLQVLRRYAYPRILNGDRPCCPSTSSKR